MGSEKVKEIKKALECCQGESLKSCEHCPYWNWCKEDDGLTFNSDTLTLINELESENKSLQYLCNKTYEDLTKEIDRLENRVKELKEGIAKSMLGCEFLPECTNDKLKQFSERLKEKFNDTEYRAKTKRKTISVEELKAQMDWILHEVVIKNIEENLKEFINKEDNKL